MPCQDTRAMLKLFIDQDDRFDNYSYHKIRCNKKIEMHEEVQKMITGKKPEYFIQLDIAGLLADCSISDPEEEFLTQKVLSSIRSVLSLYLGEKQSFTGNKAEILNIEYDLEYTLISAVVYPPENLPPILSCCERKALNGE